VAELAGFGFDGIYLDWVEAHDDDRVIAAAIAAGVDPDAEMIGFIEKLGAAGRRIDPGFLVVAQNAIYLLDADPARYGAAIDALAVEDTWFHGWGDSDWEDPDGGDQRDRHEGDYATAARLEQIGKYRARGLPVFSIDYALDPGNAAEVYGAAAAQGFVPLVSRVALSRMTETPPPALGQ
jgi:cysteinyl-tRNA synthetase